MNKWMDCLVDGQMVTDRGERNWWLNENLWTQLSFSSSPPVRRRKHIPPVMSFWERRLHHSNRSTLKDTLNLIDIRYCSYITLYNWHPRLRNIWTVPYDHHCYHHPFLPDSDSYPLPQWETQLRIDQCRQWNQSRKTTLRMIKHWSKTSWWSCLFSQESPR